MTPPPAMELSARLVRWWWAVALALVPVLYATGPLTERAAVILAAAAAMAGVLRTNVRLRAARVAGTLLLAAMLSLAIHLLRDDFAYRHVWLYSAAALPWYLKLANLWGGDESTMLFLAAVSGVLAPRLCRRDGWTARGALALVLLFAFGTTVWSPFAGTPPADMARIESQGMNAHLMSPWMVFHPPQVFAAYILLLAPAGTALQALAGRGGDWRRVAPAWIRGGWLVLSAGLVFGMWWAYEDITFGQIWHWDPVQTSVFTVWALATAQLHCLRRYRSGGTFAILAPLLALLTGIAALASMAVTRTGALASSHRYVGDTSLPLLLGAAGVLAAATVTALVAGLARGGRRRGARDESVLLIRIAVTAFLMAAAAAAWHLAEAYVGAALALPRPASLKPFFETLTRWSTPEELAAIRAAFDQWDVYGFGLNRWLVPVIVMSGLAGGHYFLPLGRRWRWVATGLAACTAAAAALWWQPLNMAYRGTGMTSGSTVAIFGWLDAALVAGVYLLASAALWTGNALQRHWRLPLVRRYFLPVGLVHMGIVVAAISGTAAMVLDSHAQKMANFPGDFGKPLALPDGYEVTLRMREQGPVADGGRGSGGGGFRAVAEAGWSLRRDGEMLEARTGHTLFRDERPPLRGERGAVRLMCEILDYRYARFAEGSGRVMHPFIHRGLWRDVQVWFPAPEYGIADDGSARPLPGRVPVILKVFPMMGWLWFGLGMALAGAAITFVYTILDGRAALRNRRGGAAPP